MILRSAIKNPRKAPLSSRGAKVAVIAFQNVIVIEAKKWFFSYIQQSAKTRFGIRQVAFGAAGLTTF